MTYTWEDVGDDPGRPLDRAEREAVATAWNTEAAGTLGRAKAAAVAAVKAAAERERLRHVTPGDGKILVYEPKRQEAAAIASDQVPDPADFPFAAARLEILRLDDAEAGLADVAAEWRAQAAAWAVAGAAIEPVYDRALRTINAATDFATVRTAVEAVAWP